MSVHQSGSFAPQNNLNGEAVRENRDLRAQNMDVNFRHSENFRKITIYILSVSICYFWWDNITNIDICVAHKIIIKQ
jgi:hypothetical protein